MDATGDVPEPLLADVTTMPLDQLVQSDNSVLGRVVDRMLAECDQPQEIISAFSNYAD